jgi:hypothetical protein
MQSSALLPWIMPIIYGITFIGALAVVFYRVGEQDAKLEALTTDTVRKEIFNLHLENLRVQMQSLVEGSKSLHSKLDRLLDRTTKDFNS